MDTTRVFTNGNSLAVRLPKEYHLNCGEVWINKNPDGSITIREKPKFPKKYKNVLAYLIDNPSEIKLEDASDFFARKEEHFEEFFK